jgi:hydroxymethylpyrimidine/phosphomethylpyrimidine kinase
MNPPVALTIAGSDSGAGAGIQADLKTFAALSVFGASAVTAVTAQNTAEVRRVFPLSPDLVLDQIEAVLDDLPVAAVKTGMLANAAIVEVVADLAAAGRLPNLVVDPVLVSSTGTILLAENAIVLYRQELLPLATVFTPNLLEAGVLLGTTVQSLGQQARAAKDLATLTGGTVVVKGGHGNDGEAVDVVCRAGELRQLRSLRVPTTNNHGSGCSFASATAAGLAQGRSIDAALDAAKSYVHRAIGGAAHWSLGSGHGPLDHFHWEEP